MKKLINKLFGKKYHVIIFFDGVQDFISSTIFKTHGEAKEFARDCAQQKKSIRSYTLVTIRTRVPLVFVNPTATNTNK